MTDYTIAPRMKTQELHPVMAKALAPWMPPTQTPLDRLNWAIERGEEFPDAAYRIARETGVDQGDLERDYDKQFT